MAKGSKKRRYYRKYYRRYKRLSNETYFRVKAEFYASLQWRNQTGDPRIAFSYAGVQGVPHIIKLSDIMQGYAYKNVLSGLFSYYKITGIRVEVIPDARNNQLDKTVTILNTATPVAETSIMVSYRAGDDTEQTLAECKANNQSILLNPRERITRYWRTYGTSGAYRSTSENLVGAFSIQNEITGNQQVDDIMYQYKTQPSFKMKINIYLLYKQSKA